MMGSIVFALTLFACNHWGGGLAGWCIWFAWRIRKEGAIPLPPLWQAWMTAFSALLVATVVSQNPSGLQWAGFLQWLSLLGGLWALQDLLREHRSVFPAVVWGLLCAGGVDAFRWTWESLSQHWEWWQIRVEGLPAFPMRLRLFGSHGSTQAASWLAGLVLLALSWRPVHFKGRVLASGWLAMVVLWTILLGLCDSRLAYAGLLAGMVVRSAVSRVSCRGDWIALLPAVVWGGRDLAHPSMVASGGGIGLGWSAFAVVLALLLSQWFAFGRGSAPLPSRSLVWKVACFSMMFPMAVPLAAWALLWIPSMDAVLTGRLSFWKVALDSWWENPVLGIGPWSYVHRYANATDWTFGFLAMHPHNAFLEVLMAGGLVLVGAMLWILVGVLRGGLNVEVKDTIGKIVPLVVSLAMGMSFDSPFSSPQVMALLTLCGGALLASLAKPPLGRCPRTLILAPFLLLVPISMIWERQVSKAPLLAAGELLRARQWSQAAETILHEANDFPRDPQWERNILMARTMQATSTDTFQVLRGDWQEMVKLEPGFLPNRVHLRWVEWHLNPDKEHRDSLTVVLERLGSANEGLPIFGQVASRWRKSYPTDDPTYWRVQLAQARNSGSHERVRWILAWFRVRFPAGESGQNAHLTVTGTRGSAELQLYGSAGTRWFLLPQIVEGSWRE